MGEFMRATSYQWRYLGDRTARSLQGTVDATTAYLGGDEEMAGNVQDDATRSPYDAPYAGVFEHRRAGPR